MVSLYHFTPLAPLNATGIINLTDFTDIFNRSIVNSPKHSLNHY